MRHRSAIHDLRAVAKRRTPRAVFDYTDDAAESELSPARARQAFEEVEFHPGVLRDVSHVDTTTHVLGGTSRLPFGIAPTGFTRLMQTKSEVVRTMKLLGVHTVGELEPRHVRQLRRLQPVAADWG